MEVAQEMGKALQGQAGDQDKVHKARDGLGKSARRSFQIRQSTLQKHLAATFFYCDSRRRSCMACAMDESFPETEVTPIIGVAAGMVAVSMACAALLSLAGMGDLMYRYRLIYDLAFPGIPKIPIAKNPHCSACGR